MVSEIETDPLNIYSRDDGDHSNLFLFSRDLSVDECEAGGERAGGDLLQPVLTVCGALHVCVGSLSAHETDDGERGRRTAQQDRQESVHGEHEGELRGRHQHGQRAHQADHSPGKVSGTVSWICPKLRGRYSVLYSRVKVRERVGTPSLRSCAWVDSRQKMH